MSDHPDSRRRPLGKDRSRLRSSQHSRRRPIPSRDPTRLSRRTVLESTGLAGVVGAVGLAGCTAPRADSHTYSPSEVEANVSSQGDADSDSDSDVVFDDRAYLDGDISMFRGGLRRLGYYPYEHVPESVTKNWQLPINYVRHNAAKASPVPTPDGETIVIPADTGRVHAVSPEGEFRWTFETEATVQGFHASPVIVDGIAYVGDYGGANYGNTASMHAIDVETGDRLWENDDLNSAVAIGSSAGYWDGYLYVVAEYRRSLSGALYVIDTETGATVWSDDRIDGMPHPTVAINPAHGRLLTGSNDGVCYCWEFPSLEFQWGFETNGEIKGPIATYDGSAFLGSWDGKFYRVDLEDGDEEWSFKTYDIVMSAPALDPDAGVVYVGSDDTNVYALDIDTGEELWSASTGGRVMSGLTVTANAVLAGSNDTHLYAFDKDTGERLWRVQNNGDVTSAAVPHDGRIYYAERANLSNAWDDDRNTTTVNAPGHAYCLVEE